MKWPASLLAYLVITFHSPGSVQASSPGGNVWTSKRKLAFRNATRDLWYHGFDNYMSRAFPLDELSPLSCTGSGPDWENPANTAFNDVSGNFSLTLVDVLDTLVVLDDPSGFQDAVKNVIDWVSFDVNTRPQVFETTIRVLGGLLSGHLFASELGQPFYLPWYRGQLLNMAYDLGTRLLPAFATPTGIPFARLNLRHGVQRGESLDTCTAGAGSLILEFATLSRLTGDERFEKAAYKAYFALWNRKSDLGLVGNTINIRTGLWTSPEVTGIGAGIDSFYEYALKWYILSGEIEFLDVWREGYAAVMRYARSPDGHWYRNINPHTGDQAYTTIDSLSAFWPGLQVLSGDVQNAVTSHLIYWNIWRRHSGLPEVWDAHVMQATSFQYPLRPEFIESTWYLYRATRDTYYLDVGERVLRDIIGRAKVECGLTGIKDLRTNARDDRMESFALSETIKYLYLLFDEENRLHMDDSHYVLTTEGHILSLPRHALKPISPARRRLRRQENHQCPAYHPFQGFVSSGFVEGLVHGVGSRSDVDYARELTGLKPQSLDERYWSPNGWCSLPQVNPFSYDFIMSPGGRMVIEDPHLSTAKLQLVPDGFLLHNITGIRAQVVSRLDGKGYDITKLGPHAVRTGQLVYINDTALLPPEDETKVLHSPNIRLRIFLDTSDPMLPVQPGMLEMNAEIHVTAHTALFGADLKATSLLERAEPLRFGRTEGVRIQRDNTNLLGCKPFDHDFAGDTVFLWRGDCTFLEKLVHARNAGASGVIVASNEDSPINPSATAEEIAAVGDLDDVALVLLPLAAGKSIAAMVEAAGVFGYGHVLFSIDSEGWSGQARASEETAGLATHVLYINGHPLQNTRLLV
ncbi:glycoside hydrolase family 47 protein [Paxillus rubicundulus Ve08.2h10]|uniref:alpha-1,2-Mannosidase n=1 Tax=Paxillus rubicundulus Ve08.2h10 TaxID=930991 RepID=A0A0D0DJU9_9AGAM|nr:glycoside hydrolase family 47 protein [Paxillus rubicundulus Ve08.2h10]